MDERGLLTKLKGLGQPDDWVDDAILVLGNSDLAKLAFFEATDDRAVALVNKMLAGVAAGLGHAAGISPATALSSSLPVATTSSTFREVPSASTGHNFKPGSVCAWTQVDPNDPASSPLEGAIMTYQDAANTAFLGRDGTPPRLSQPMRNVANPLDSEADVASAYHLLVSDVHTRLAHELPFASAASAQWKQLPSKDIICDALSYTQQHLPATGSQSGLPFLRSRRERPMQPVVHHKVGVLTAPTTISNLKMDLVLTIEAEQHTPVPGPGREQADLVGEQSTASHGVEATVSMPQTDDQPAAKRRRCICVGEVKIAERLMCGLQQPVDLVAAWGSEGDPHWSQAQAVVAQLFTYMQLWKICYGFITCYFGTWLAYCPPRDREILYLSKPILSTTCLQPDAPAVTVMGAGAWLQQQAFQFAGVDVLPHPGPANGSAGDPPDEDTDERDVGARTESAEEYQDSRGRDTGSNASRSGTATTSKSLHSLPGGPTVLQLHHKLCSGSTGSIMRGAYGSDEAVVKLLGPDSHGLLDYERELQAYTLLAGVQGDVVPRLLGAGHLAAGVQFLATQLVVGRPLSSLPSIPPAVASAAVSALTRVQQAHTGFVHGDISLQNFMLADNTAGKDTTASCMVIDFGRSHFNGTSSSQAKELKRLKCLLGMA